MSDHLPPPIITLGGRVWQPLRCGPLNLTEADIREVLAWGSTDGSIKFSSEESDR